MNFEKRRCLMKTFLMFHSSNPGQNILELYDTLVQVRFATSNTNLDT